MNKLLSTSLIVGALFVLESTHTTLLARGGHGGGGHEAAGRSVDKAISTPQEVRRDVDRPVDSNITKEVNRQVDKDLMIENRNDYYGVGGYTNLNQGCWTGADGVVQCK